MLSKAELRRIKKAERDALAPEQRREWSTVMAETMSQTFEYQQCDIVTIYLSIGSEPDTLPLIQRAWSDTKKVYVPVVDPASHHMVHKEYTSVCDIVTGTFGIPEPVGTETLTSSDINPGLLSVVPLLAFNELLYRVGYGKGFYDRFLESRNFFAFGYGFTDSFSQEFEPESHDIRLDGIVTEQGIVRIRRSVTRHVNISW